MYYMQKSKSNRPTGYALTKLWFDFAENNPEKHRPIHGILFLWIVELNNTLGWTEKFKLPSIYSMHMIGASTYKTYKKALDDLVKWGFIRIVSKSVNQYTACVVTLVKNTNADDEAETSALVNNTRALLKQSSGIVSIDKHNKLLKDKNSLSQTQKETEEELSEERGESYSSNSLNSNPGVTYLHNSVIISQDEETGEEKAETSPSIDETSPISKGVSISINSEEYLSVEKACIDLKYRYTENTISTLLNMGPAIEIIHILKKTREGNFLRDTKHLSGIIKNLKELSKAYPMEYLPTPSALSKTILDSKQPRYVSNEYIAIQGTRLGDKYKSRIELFNSFDIPFHYEEVKQLDGFGFKHHELVEFMNGLAEKYPDELEKLKSPGKGISELLLLLKRCSK